MLCLVLERRYLKGWFILDALSSLPVALVAHVVDVHGLDIYFMSLKLVSFALTCWTTNLLIRCSYCHSALTFRRKPRVELCWLTLRRVDLHFADTVQLKTVSDKGSEKTQPVCGLSSLGNTSCLSMGGVTKVYMCSPLDVFWGS